MVKLLFTLSLIVLQKLTLRILMKDNVLALNEQDFFVIIKKR